MNGSVFCGWLMGIGLLLSCVPSPTVESSPGGPAKAARADAGATEPGSAGGTSGAARADAGFSFVIPPAVDAGADAGPDLTGFTMTERGGYKLGDPITANGTGSTVGIDSPGCHQLLGVVRDFRPAHMGGHPDFESFSGGDQTKGLVATELGPDRKPVYASTCDSPAVHAPSCPFGQQTTSKANFDQWYRSTEGVNKPYLVYFLVDTVKGVSTFSSSSFFPLDNSGWQDTARAIDGKEHNFAFTTEIHTTFRYNGGEQFTFSGDDDLWVFVNGKLAIDLGGLHASKMAVIDLDKSAAALEITTGREYPLELFHAERHTTMSNFRIDTNFMLISCGKVIF